MNKLIKENIVSSASKKETSSNITVVKNMRDYRNDPVFKKKAEDTAKFIKKHGLPDHFKKGS